MSGMLLIQESGEVYHGDKTLSRINCARWCLISVSYCDYQWYWVTGSCSRASIAIDSPNLDLLQLRCFNYISWLGWILHNMLSLNVGEKLSSPLLIFVQDPNNLNKGRKVRIDDSLQEIVENIHWRTQLLNVSSIILAKLLISIGDVRLVALVIGMAGRILLKMDKYCWRGMSKMTFYWRRIRQDEALGQLPQWSCHFCWG